MGVASLKLPPGPAAWGVLANKFAQDFGAAEACCCGGDERGVVDCCVGGEATSEGAELVGVELTPLVMSGSLGLAGLVMIGVVSTAGEEAVFD